MCKGGKRERGESKIGREGERERERERERSLVYPSRGHERTSGR